MTFYRIPGSISPIPEIRPPQILETARNHPQPSSNIRNPQGALSSDWGPKLPIPRLDSRNSSHPPESIRKLFLPTVAKQFPYPGNWTSATARIHPKPSTAHPKPSATRPKPSAAARNPPQPIRNHPKPIGTTCFRLGPKLPIPKLGPRKSSQHTTTIRKHFLPTVG